MNILTRFQNKYFNAKAFFGLDLCLSVGASVIVLLVLSFFASSSYYSGNFAWWWIGGSVVASIIAMLVFKELQYISDRLSISALLFANEKEAQHENTLIDYCNHNNIKLLIAPTINEVEEGRLLKSRVRAIKIEDLLGRPEIELSMDAIIDNFKGKIVLVTGAAGSIGSELCRQLATFGVSETADIIRQCRDAHAQHSS